MIPIELIDRLRAWFFARDRDIRLQSGRQLILHDGRIVDEHVVPSGGVIFWPSTAGAIPSGWTTFSAAAGRFLVGAGGSFSSGATGGATTIDIQHSHTVGTLAVGGGGTHSHGVTSINVSGPSSTVGVAAGGDFDAADQTHVHSLTGTTDNDIHSHILTGSTATVLSSAQSILPPYLVGTWIQKS